MADTTDKTLIESPEGNNTNQKKELDKLDGEIDSTDKHLPRQPLDKANDSDQLNPVRDIANPSAGLIKDTDGQGNGSNQSEKSIARSDPDLNSEQEIKDGYWIYHGEPWNGNYYHKVTRRCDSFAVATGDSVAVKNLIGLHTVLFIVKNKQYNKVLLADPTMKLVVEVKFGDVISIEGQASSSQKTQLEEVFKNYYEAKKRKVSPIKPELKEAVDITKKAIRTQPSRASRTAAAKPILKKEIKPERSPVGKKKDAKKPKQKKKPDPVPDPSLSSESEEMVIEQYKPPIIKTAKTVKVKEEIKEVPPVIQLNTVTDTAAFKTITATLPKEITTSSSPAVLPFNSQIQSLLDLQQMHHRQALAQQQLNFMLVLQQQQQAESDSAFRNLMQKMQQRTD